MADLLDNLDCDVPNRYCMQSKTWGSSIVKGVQRSEFIAQLKSIPHGSQGIGFVKVSQNNGMQFIQMGDQMFHAKLIQVPWNLFPRHPV